MTAATTRGLVLAGLVLGRRPQRGRPNASTTPIARATFAELDRKRRELGEGPPQP